MSKFKSVTIMKSLSHPVRLSVMQIMQKTCTEGYSAGDIFYLLRHFNISAPAISQHVRRLLKEELLVRKKDGRHVIYSINPNVKTTLEKYL